MVDHADIDHTGITGAGGSVATDPIWDAAGDLAVGSGANTAAKLAKGTALQVLRVNSGATNLEWGSVAGAMQVVRKAADESKSATAFADSTGMGFAVSASTNYHFRYVVFYNTNATTVGIRLAINGPASPTALVAGVIQGTSPDGNDGTIGTGWVGVYDAAMIPSTTGPGAANFAVAIIEGILVNGANAGTLILRHASETATATTIYANSFGTLVQF